MAIKCGLHVSQRFALHVTQCFALHLCMHVHVFVLQNHLFLEY